MLEGHFATKDAPTPEAHKRQQEEILRKAAIEAATSEELDAAIEQVRRSEQERPNPVLKNILKDLEEARKGKTETPPTLH